MVRNIGIILILLLNISLLSSCGETQDSVDNDSYIYFLNDTKDSLEKVQYNIEAEETELIVEELLKNMEANSEEGKYFSAKPNSIETPEFLIVDKTLTLYFEDSYSEIKRTDEILYRAALVLTMTQIEDINYVNMYVGEQPLLDSNGLPLSNLTTKNFVDLSGEITDLDQEVSLLMYYPNEDGEMLVGENYEGEIESNTSLEEVVVSKLKGKVFSENVEVYSVLTRDSVCYVDFSKEFNIEYVGIDDSVAIYSIVNSLCELSNISQVKISVDGDSDLKYHENISLNQNFTRNLDLVE